MAADGWTVVGRQFEGGFWYNRLECVGADGKTQYSMYLQTNGSKIFYMEFKVYGLRDYLAKRAAEEATGGTEWYCESCREQVVVPYMIDGEPPIYCEECYKKINAAK